ncbi:hypothetical protein CVT24_000156 [Panaeolus cyanescens]|uniref:beta-galactosidase n=1 Tax=Panaeolus cyanescens TaxID=181874 RepID=A0A409VIS1_9AGAR|nr:hypothetical protein CVT24_000156 [Panaeolus cyanescens]
MAASERGTTWNSRSWKFLAGLCIASVCFNCTTAVLAEHTKVAQRATQARTDQVQFDQYSLVLRGQRVFLHSGEFHTFRLPVVSLWADILEKVKAAGLNSVSVYTHMGLMAPAPGVVDLDGYRALQPLFDAAKEAGIWVVLRPETTAGGLSHWATSEVTGQLRSNASDWQAAWTPYIGRVIKDTIPNQINHGGPVIAVQVDNEFSQDPETHAQYFVQIENLYHNSDIVVPLTYNDPGQKRNFINGTGAVDLYGQDAYPQRYDCTHPTVWPPTVPTNFWQYHADVNPWQPSYVPEFQAGSFDPWGPTSPGASCCLSFHNFVKLTHGYEGCRILTGPEYMSVSNLNLWAANAKLINYYMFYGGTSWGALPFPGIYSSYDYGAAIKENRDLTAKYDEQKRQGLFIRSSPEFYKTDWIADSLNGLNISSNPAAFLTHLRNPDTGSNFYVARQADSPSTATITFKLDVSSSQGPLQLPLVADAITLGGRESKVIVTDYSFGKSSRLLYSTSPVLYAGTIDNRDVIFLHGNSLHQHEIALSLTGIPNPVQPNPLVKVTTTHGSVKKGTTVVTFMAGLQGFATVYDSSTQLVLYADTPTATTFWSPVLPGKTNDPFKNFWGIGTNSSILVGGPHLVRAASISGGTQLKLRGDLKEDVALTVIAPKAVKSITWNDQPVALDPRAGGLISKNRGAFVGKLRVREVVKGAGVKVPKLSGWKFKDSLPEVSSSGFDDSEWIVANKTSSNIPHPPVYGDGRYLYGCDYGFCENTVLWRGHFVSNGNEKSVNLSINGGEAFAASIWVNNVFLGTSFGNSTNNRNSIEEVDQKFDFTAGALKAGADNVITIVQDNMGLSEAGYGDDLEKSPRGVRGFALDNGNKFTVWKVQGKVGGYNGYPDKKRGVLNEGGFFGERKGWHLPGFSTTDWVHRDLSAGLPGNGAGVGFFVTTFRLDLPKGIDAMLSFTFEELLGQPYRAFLFVNGWMMGKRVGNLGPQDKFPVHEGILDYHGENTVAVALWSMTPDVPVAPNLQLTLDALYDGGVTNVKTDNPRWSPSGRN